MNRHYVGRLLLLVALVATACGGSPGPVRRDFELEVKATSDDGKALPGVSLARTGRVLGKTDASGRLVLRIAGPDGEVVPLAVTCPDGFLNEKKPLSVRLASTRRVGQAAPQPLRVDASCTRARRDVVLVVHAVGGGGLPVKVNSEHAVDTDADGNAHVLLQVDRGVRALEVELDTSARADLQPKNPRKIFDLSGRDAVLVVQQSLTPVRVRSGVARSRVPQRHVPTRID
jgi:hypothetical protein